MSNKNKEKNKPVVEEVKPIDLPIVEPSNETNLDGDVRGDEKPKDDVPVDNVSGDGVETEAETETLAPKPLSIEKLVEYSETFLKKVDKEIEEFEGLNAREINLMAINVKKTISSLKSSVKFLNECLKQPE